MSVALQGAVIAAYPQLEKYGFTQDDNTRDGGGLGGEHFDYRLTFKDPSIYQVLANYVTALDSALRKSETGFRVEMDPGDGHRMSLRFFHNSDQPFMLHELEQAVNSALVELHATMFLKAYVQHAGGKASFSGVLSADTTYSGFPRRIVFRMAGESDDIANVIAALSASAALVQQKATVSRDNDVITIQNGIGISTPELADEGRFQGIRAQVVEHFIRELAQSASIRPDGMAVTLDLRHQTERGYPKDAYISLGFGVFPTSYDRVADALGQLAQKPGFEKLAGYTCTAVHEEGSEPQLHLHADEGFSASTLGAMTKALRSRGA